MTRTLAWPGLAKSRHDSSCPCSVDGRPELELQGLLREYDDGVRCEVVGGGRWV